MINIFAKELKSHIKSLIFWSIGMSALVFSGMAKYSVYKTSGQSINQLINQFPQTVRSVLGMTGFDLSQASGYYGFIFIFIAVLAAIHSGTLGSDLISNEERDKTTEFLFVKPITRTKVITQKLLCGIFNLLIINLTTLVSSILALNYYNNGNSINDYILILMIGLFFIQLIFFSLSTFVASINNKPKTSASIATGIVLFSYIVYVFTNISASLETLKYITPFKYFDAKDLLKSNTLDTTFIAISLIIILLSLTFTYIFFNKRDLEI